MIKWQIVLAVLIGGLVMGGGVVAALMWDRDNFNPGQPPEKIEDTAIDDNIPVEDPGLGHRIIYVNNPTRRAGAAPTKDAEEKAEKFVESAQDSTLPAELPEVKGRYRKGKMTLAVGDSKGILQRAEWDCGDDCDFGTRDNKLFNESPRQIFSRDWKSRITRCAIFTGGGAIIGHAAWDAGVEGAVVGGATCLAVEVAI